MSLELHCYVAVFLCIVTGGRKGAEIHTSQAGFMSRNMTAKQCVCYCRYAAEWEQTVTRLGRWIDFKNDYKTLNPTFMESVWWVFGQLWEKGLVYQGFKARLSHYVTPRSIA